MVARMIDPTRNYFADGDRFQSAGPMILYRIVISREAFDGAIVVYGEGNAWIVEGAWPEDGLFLCDKERISFSKVRIETKP